MDNASLAEFAFTSERDAAAKLQQAAHAAGMKLYPLPYSRYDPDRTTWWLSPVTTNPAYASGKIVVENPTIVDDGTKLIGLHMEKGVGEAAAEFFQATAGDRHQVMDRSWTWHPFLRALRSGELDADMRDAAAAGKGLPLVVEVVAAPALPKGGGDEHPLDLGAADRIRYEWTDGSLTTMEARKPTKLAGFSDFDVARRQDRPDRGPGLDVGRGSDRRAFPPGGKRRPRGHRGLAAGVCTVDGLGPIGGGR